MILALISRIWMKIVSVKIVRRHTAVKSADHAYQYCLSLTTGYTFQHAFSQHLPLLVRRASIFARPSASSGRHTRRSNVPVPMTATPVVVHDNIYYWFTLRLACLLEYLATPFELQACVGVKVNEWGCIAQREQSQRFDASKIYNPHPRRLECKQNCSPQF